MAKITITVGEESGSRQINAKTVGTLSSNGSALGPGFLGLRPATVQSTKRVRRGFLNIGGDQLKTVLGVATERDVQDLRQAFTDTNQGIITSLKKVYVIFNHEQSTLSTLIDPASNSLKF
jgi:hypothetical protein